MAASFADLGVSQPVVRALATRNILEPFPVQTLVIPDALAGRDVLVRSKTGSGKTLAFAIPIVERVDANARGAQVLILTPTRELAQQVAGEFKGFAGARHLRVGLAYGGASIGQQATATRKAHIIVATPGRLEDMITRRMVSLDSIKTLVLDEADHMLDLGFLPQVDKIVARISQDRQTMLFSATLDGEVGKIAGRYTRDAIRHAIASPRPAVAEVSHRFVAVAQPAKNDALSGLLRSESVRTLVFVRTKHGADRVVRKLAQQGIPAAAMHGDKTQSARELALARFATGKIDALVATDVAARGIDVRDIARVVNFDAPNDDKAFVHRVGRTGRAGRTGVSITFVTPEQEAEVSLMAHRLRLHAEFAAANMSPSRTRPSGGDRKRHAPSRPARPRRRGRR